MEMTIQKDDNIALKKQLADLLLFLDYVRKQIF